MLVVVIDIGKSNRKLALVDARAGRELRVLQEPNAVLTDGLYPHYDIDAIWRFVLDGLAQLARDAGEAGEVGKAGNATIEAITVTTHGAAAVLLDAAGQPAMPVLDYEHEGPESITARYRAIRPPFDETGSPDLPIGLNLGRQIAWQQWQFPEDFARVQWIVLYPQYWTWRLSGVLASEYTSLGCHTDLWAPRRGDWSSLVTRHWASLMPPLSPADATLGTLLPDIATRTGLSATTRVCCGIHDSNASLLPYLRGNASPFAVVSTGTWVITMAVGARPVTLAPERDTLVNVDADGQPVPSARFMGGREFATLMQGYPVDGDTAKAAQAAIGDVVKRSCLLLPAVENGCGPYQGHVSRWLCTEPRDAGERLAAVSLYLALVSATCLDIIGARGPVFVEGPFGENRLYCELLAWLCDRPVHTGSHTGTSVGAALLALGSDTLQDGADTAQTAIAPSAILERVDETALQLARHDWHAHA